MKLTKRGESVVPSAESVTELCAMFSDEMKQIFPSVRKTVKLRWLYWHIINLELNTVWTVLFS